MGATYSRRGPKSWLVAVHSHGQRSYKMVKSEADAKALVQHIHKQELAGVNVIEAIRKARAAVAPAPTYPPLQEAVSAWLEGQVRSGELRASTGTFYQRRLTTWVWPTLGARPLDQVTREALGAIVHKMRQAGRSRALIGGVYNPLKSYYQSLIETKAFPGPNPAGDLKPFIGKGLYKRAKARQLSFFAQEEGPALMATAQALVPRWAPFIMTGLLAGLRWGESAALFKADLDWKRGRIHVQRTLSEGGRMEAPKDAEGRHVKASPALLAALKEHIEKIDLEGQINRWTPEQRQLVFPTKHGRPIERVLFFRTVWTPVLKKAGLPYRKYHSTRHTFATWLLSDGADIRWVQNQLGHASITLTADTYGHVQPEKHEAAVEKLDRYLS